MVCYERIFVELHGPSVGIGAGITAVVIVAAFFAFGSMSQSEIELQPATIPEAEEEAISMSVFTANGSPLLGNPNAPITLVEFGDYQCHFCNVFFHETEDDILKNYVETGKVRMMFKDFTIIGPDSVNAAHGAHCANDQGLFWEYHDELYNNWNGENNGWASPENLKRFAENVQLDIEQWEECMVGKNYDQRIKDSNNDARTLGLTGTPAFFVIGPTDQVTKIGGAQPFYVFEQIFESELGKQ